MDFEPKYNVKSGAVCSDSVGSILLWNIFPKGSLSAYKNSLEKLGLHYCAADISCIEEKYHTYILHTKFQRRPLRIRVQDFSKDRTSVDAINKKVIQSYKLLFESENNAENRKKIKRATNNLKFKLE